MSVQIVEKSANFHSPTTTSSVNKTPFGIEDILYINNNNNNQPSFNKNHQMKKGESEEFKKLTGNER